MAITTLSYGYKKPSNPTTGDLFFPAMEDNIQQLNDHNHNGVNSAPLSAFIDVISSAGWTSAPQGGGVYRQAVTMPAGFDFDVCQIWFKTTNGECLYPTVERIGSSSYYIYSNDNTADFQAYYR
jgi:hypothetical protein